MLHPGQVIDRYEVEATLGEGGMARVFRVRHTTLHSVHALKVLTVGGQRVRERLLAEGRVQAGLDHPHAVTVTDVIDVSGSPGLVMEFVDGGTLDSWVEDEAPSRADRLELFTQVCDAVSEAHRRGWVHRDLKPGNVLIKDVGNRRIAKVADFGLVKAVLGDTPLSKGRTRSGVAMGTPGFMAPEQIADAATVDVRADVFSLGCILLWLLTDQDPFPGTNTLQIFENVVAGNRVQLPEDDVLRPLVDACLSHKLDDRPSSAQEILEILRQPAPSADLPAPEVPSTDSGGRYLFYGCMGALGVVTVALCSMGGLGLYTQIPGTLPTCAVEGRGRVGYAKVDMKRVRRGMTVTLQTPAKVIVSPQAQQVKPLCALPPGTEVDVREAYHAPWLPIYRGSTRIPSP